jgi:phenylalanyl-tRNA synthetase beta chain
MLISLEWLSQYVPTLTTLAPQRIAEALTQAGLEVEGALQAVGPQFRGVVLAQVTALAPHPNADKLRLVTLNQGLALGSTQVVCGAPNVAVGQYVAFAQNGATVFSKKTGSWFTLTPATIRGVESAGMVCALEELALEGQFTQEGGGIWELNAWLNEHHPQTAQQLLGQPLEALLGLETDTLLHTAPTANRGDWMSYHGVARELAAMEALALTLPTTAPTTLPWQAASPVGVQLSQPQRCPLFMAATLQSVAVGPSPAWLAKRLQASGIRSINNVVDVTNYVMLETGQPLHAFDLQRLQATTGSGTCVFDVQGGEAFAGQVFEALDGASYTLNEASVLVCANGQPVSLAGVMGGASTAIEEGTTQVVLEAAFFPSASTRRSARSVGIRTESSARFERGVDPGGVHHAFARALELLQQVAGGSVASCTQHAAWEPAGLPAPAPITLAKPLNLQEMEAFLGLAEPLSPAPLKQALETLGFGLTPCPQQATAEAWQVTVPTWRQRDVAVMADLAEEVARLHGFEHIPATLPPRLTQQHTPQRQPVLHHLHQILQGFGLQEVMTTSLTGPAWLATCATPAQASTLVGLSNSHSAEHTQLRQSMVPSLLEVAQHNGATGHSALALYEVGRTYFKRSQANPKHSGVQENVRLGLLLLGPQQPAHWQQASPKAADFYTLKGLVESTLAALGLSAESLAFEAPSLTEGVAGCWHPGQVAHLWLKEGSGKPKLLGTLGAVHPSVASRLKLKHPAFVADLDLDALLKQVLKQQGQSGHGCLALNTSKAPSPFPAVERDLAWVLPKACTQGALRQCLLQVAAQQEAFKGLALFDVYQGKGLEPDTQSLAYRLRWQAAERTLTDAEVEAWVNELCMAAQATLGATLRG